MSELPITAREARERAIKDRSRALRRRDEVREQVRVKQDRAHRTHSIRVTPLDRLVDEVLKDDRHWHAAVSDNQWWLMQATAFGAVETVDMLKVIAAQNAEMIKILKEIRDDRRASSTGEEDAQASYTTPVEPT